MLKDVSVWLIQEGNHVTVIWRQQNKMQRLINEAKNASKLTPLLVDYTNYNSFNFFQRVSKHPLKEVKASGRCHGIGKEFFVQAQSRYQLCRGIIDIGFNRVLRNS
ncbi:hypothetical protein ACQKOF_16760 [Lysinibacillus sp. NPDC093190]|uniref:hypothetical protein n=1 Tax=Lysinibacillus sp. NPDC093190 TaxID=3390575 RepID=UPI003D06CA87